MGRRPPAVAQEGEEEEEPGRLSRGSPNGETGGEFTMRVVRWCKPENGNLDVALLEHISPIEWDNVILYGQYVLDRAQVR